MLENDKKCQKMLENIKKMLENAIKWGGGTSLLGRGMKGTFIIN